MRANASTCVKKRKHPLLWVFIGIMAISIVVGVMLGKQYYEHHYVDTDSYAMAPKDHDMQSVPVKSPDDTGV